MKELHYLIGELFVKVLESDNTAEAVFTNLKSSKNLNDLFLFP